MGNLLADAVAAVTETNEPMLIRLQLPIPFDEDKFWSFCRQNPELQIEQTAEGELILMAPAGGESGYRNSDLTTQLRIWAKKDGSGRSFDSSTGYTMASGAQRSPDASWILLPRLTALTPQQKSRFMPLCPDFVVELRSPSDRLPTVQAKMGEYIASGARLGWLIDPTQRIVYVYRPEQSMEVHSQPATIAADPELPGFVLDLQEIWTPGF